MARLLILYLCSLTLRSLVFAALAGLITFRMRSVARRHAVWTAVLGCVLLMPAADALLPAAMVPAGAPEIVVPVQTFVVVAPAVRALPVGTRTSAPAIVPEVSRDWWQIAALLWVVVAAAFLCRLALACGAIARMKRRSLPISMQGCDENVAPMLRESGSVTVPLTVGLWKPVLILPLDWREWESWKLRAVLAHELTHVRRMDWAIAVAASFTRCVFWFNPLNWWLERHLSSLAEQASDEACVHATGDAPRYAETLLNFASVAKRGRRWIGGVAMAQYKISFRIERVLRLQRAGSGMLSRAGWVAVCLLAIPALYVSAAAQSLTRTQMPPLSPAELIRVVQQQGPLSAQAPMVVASAPQQSVQPAPQLPVDNSAAAARAEVLTPTASAGIFRYWTGWAPSAQQPPNSIPAPAAPPSQNAPVQVNPDLVGEIRLILAPVDQAPGTAPGQVQIQTSTGNNRYTGTAVWNVRNSALNPATWASNVTWANNGNAFSFALTGVQGRYLSFEDPKGTGGYGCPDCSFMVWETGMGAPSINGSPAIVFRLSLDGKSVATTCRAVECRVGTAAISTAGSLQAIAMQSLKDSETRDLAIPQQPSVDPSKPVLTCFSVFGNVKADGTPFTASDCPGGVLAFRTVLFFSVAR